uniref:Uncharacterized protein n=1 Tax=viral metagenome TaxID=1070528 RepID=A0A6C0J5R8_9ZZZZ
MQTYLIVISFMVVSWIVGLILSMYFNKSNHALQVGGRGAWGKKMVSRQKKDKKKDRKKDRKKTEKKRIRARRKN